MMMGSSSTYWRTLEEILIQNKMTETTRWLAVAIES